MKKLILQKSIAFTLVLFVIVSLSSCYSKQRYDYYKQKENYITVSGIISHIAYNQKNDALYIGFSQLSSTFDDTSFKIVGDNLAIVKNNGIDDKIKIGKSVVFTTAPRYFGDGYVMPIVAISINGEELLSFEDGWSNFLKTLQSE